LLRRTHRYLRTAGALALAGGSLLAGGAPAGAAASIAIGPMMVSRFASATQPLTQSQCVAIFTEPCYLPAQIQTAYNEQPLFNSGITGAGQTIVIVDSFGSPTIKSDLATFDSQFNLPAPPSFRIIQPAGKVPAYNPNNSDMVGWAGETTLDVEWSHTIAPGANILLVETPVSETEGTAGFPQIVKAENYVIDHHLGDVITQSFGATEQTFTSQQQLLSQRSAYFNALAHNVSVLASSGDTGAANYEFDGTDLYPFPTVGWPASDPLVTGVGGLQLHLDQNGFRTAPDNVWNDPASICSQPCAGSGGLSSVFDRPFFQDRVARVVGRDRGVPDVSLNAAVSSAVNVWMSFDGLTGGFYQIAGAAHRFRDDKAGGHGYVDMTKSIARVSSLRSARRSL